MLEAEDGALIDAVEHGRRVRCGDVETDAPLLVPALVELLDEYNAAYQDADLRIEINDGCVEIVGAADYESANSAQRALREVLTAICADDLRSSDLTALVYAEDALDEEWAAKVWSLLMKLPELLGMRPNATLAILAGDCRVNFDVHCAGHPSMRDRLLDGGGLQSRHAPQRARQPIRDLRSFDASKMPLIPLFLGAGASVVDGLPTGDGLRNEALEFLLGHAVDRVNFDSSAREFWDKLESQDELSPGELGTGQDAFVSNLTLERVITHEQRRESQVFSSTLRRFAERHSKITEAMRLARDAGDFDDDPLARLVRLQSRVVLVTVNFDRLIESRVSPGSIQSFVTEQETTELGTYLDSYAVSGGPVPLLKLHGDIELPDTIVANITETQAGLSSVREGALADLMTRIDAQEIHPWWYVGYSMRDEDLAVTWRSPRVAAFNEHWVSPFLDPHVDRFISRHRLRAWERRQLPSTAMERAVTLTASDFFAELANALA